MQISQRRAKEDVEGEGNSGSSGNQNAGAVTPNWESCIWMTFKIPVQKRAVPGTSKILHQQMGYQGNSTGDMKTYIVQH